MVKKRNFAICQNDCKVRNSGNYKDEIEIKRGTLIEIITQETQIYQIKLRNFHDWNPKYINTIYNCDKKNICTVSEFFWPFLIGIKNDEDRLEFVKLSSEWTIDIGSNIVIRDKLGLQMGDKEEIHGVITYKGVVPEIGLGFYFGVQLKVNKKYFVAFVVINYILISDKR